MKELVGPAGSIKPALTRNLAILALSLFLAPSASAYDHGHGQPKGPPADIPAHIKERTSPDGAGVNLNGSQVGVPGMMFMSNDPQLDHVISMALKGNLLGDEGARSPSPTNQKRITAVRFRLQSLGARARPDAV